MRSLSSFLRGLPRLTVGTLLLLASTVTPLRTAACAGDPGASITVSSESGSVSATNGAIFTCPVGSDGSLAITFTAASVDDTADNVPIRTSNSYTVCSGRAADGSCAFTLTNSITGGNSAAPRSSIPVVLSSVPTGEVRFTIEASTYPKTTPMTADPLTCKYANNQCVSKCATCTQTITARCFHNDPAGLAAAIAASSTGGVGSNDGTIVQSAFVPGTTLPATDNWGPSLPLSAGQSLNPRCALTALSMQQAYASSTSKQSLSFPLPSDGSSGEVVITDCSAYTADQIAMLTNPSVTAYSAGTTFLGLTGPSMCTDVRQYSNFGLNMYDTRVTSYTISGDVVVTASKAPSSGTSEVCGDNAPIIYGPMAHLPANTWRSSSIQVTVTHTTVASLCDDGTCAGGNANGACASCSYTYTVRFACDPSSAPTSSTGNASPPTTVASSTAAAPPNGGNTVPPAQGGFDDSAGASLPSAVPDQTSSTAASTDNSSTGADNPPAVGVSSTAAAPVSGSDSDPSSDGSLELGSNGAACSTTSFVLLAALAVAGAMRL